MQFLLSPYPPPRTARKNERMKEWFSSSSIRPCWNCGKQNFPYVTTLFSLPRPKITVDNHTVLQGIKCGKRKSLLKKTRKNKERAKKG
jgi:hypothetical protein